MADLTAAEWAEAERRGREIEENEPHARAARYDRKSGMLVIELTNDATFTMPARYLQGFSEAAPEQIEKVELSPLGFGLHWEELDADFTVGGLLAGRFGTARYMKEFNARRGSDGRRSRHSDSRAA